MIARNWLILPLIFVGLMCSVSAHAATVIAASCSSSSVQSAINSASSGDTVGLPSCGSTTWTSTVTISNKALTLQGQSNCSGTPVTSCTDSTNIDDQGSGGAALSVTGVSNSNFVRITGITFIKDANHGNGIVQITGNYGQVGFRFDHNHILEKTTGSRGIYPVGTWGLIDHNWFDVEATTGSNQMISADGTSEGGDGGFTPWATPLTLGSNHAIVIEDNYFFTSPADAGAEDIIDGYSGVSYVIRHNQFTNSSIGFHGTDSGGVRGLLSAEVYNNTFTNNSSANISGGGMRSGTGVWFNNTYNGSYNPVKLSVYRQPNLEPDNSSQWGVCDGHQNWTLSSADHTLNAGRYNSNKGTDWQPNHAYSNMAPIQPSSGNSGNFNYTAQGSCTSGGSRPGFTQSIYGSSSDGSCSWLNEGGGASGAGVKWCAINRDTVCTADSTCSAIKSGDTCSAYFDGGGVGSSGYPCRDQVGRGSNQVLAPVYAWSNTGSGSGLAPNSSSSYLTPGIDYYPDTPKPGYSAYVYPDPLQNGTVAKVNPPSGLAAVVQ